MNEGENVSDVKPESRTFYWVWFGLFTAVSMVVNGWHGGIKAPLHFAMLKQNADTHLLWEAWKVSGDRPPTWFTLGAIALGVLMPIALAFGSHALANPRPDIGNVRHRVNVALTMATVIGSFILSFLAMQDMAVMLMGWSPLVAAILPIAVDIAIVSALAGLTAHSPRMVNQAVEQRVEQHVMQLDAARASDLERIMTHLESTREADREALHDALVTQVEAAREATHDALMGQLDAARDALVEQVNQQVAAHSAQRPTVNGAAVQRPAPRTAAPLDLPGDPSVLAAELVEQGKVSQPVEVVHRVLELAVGGLSQRKIADELLDVSSSTAGRIISAARQLDQQRDAEHQDAWQLLEAAS